MLRCAIIALAVTTDDLESRKVGKKALPERTRLRLRETALLRTDSYTYEGEITDHTGEGQSDPTTYHIRYMRSTGSSGSVKAGALVAISNN